MKKVLVLGSVCADLTLYIDMLPETEEDISVRKQRLSLGGCAANIANMLRLMKVPYGLASISGEGLYGDFVRKKLELRQMKPMFQTEEENGSCICLVDSSGNRTFLSCHGAEYRYRPEWMAMLKPIDWDSVYICGIDLEEKENECVIEWLEKSGLPVWFGPGPRVSFLSEEILHRMMALHPIMHMNLREADQLLKKMKIKVPAEKDAGQIEALSALTRQTVILTEGAAGCIAYDGKNMVRQSAMPAVQKDGTGAGDSHFGTVIGTLRSGGSLTDALYNASVVSSAVVEEEGPVLPDSIFERIRKKLKL